MRANFSNDSVALSWDEIPSTTISYGYKVYYDNDTYSPPYDGTGLNEGASPIDVGNATTFTLTGLGSGTYYLVVTAYDTLGRESWYSNEEYNKGACPTITDWKGEYWNNDSLSGESDLCRNDDAIDFDWQDGSPDSSISSDHFSVRWTRDIDFETGTYEFDIYHDNGVRLYIDETLIFENWCEICWQTDVVTSTLVEGFHNIVMEMYENTGWAGAKLSWQLSSTQSSIYIPVVMRDYP